MLPLLVLVDPLEGDARLKAPFTVAERYLPLPDLARRLAEATGERIAVDPPLRPRKLVLFVDGRPVAETMARIADALDARWTPVKGGWSLVPVPESVKAEADARRDREVARRLALLDWTARASRPPQSSKDNLKAKVALLLSDIGPDRAADALLAGRMLVGTSDGRAGMRVIDMADAFVNQPFHNIDGTIRGIATEGMILLKWDGERGRVITTLRSLGEKQTTGARMGRSAPGDENRPRRTRPEGRRLGHEWRGGDRRDGVEAASA